MLFRESIQGLGRKCKRYRNPRTGFHMSLVTKVHVISDPKAMDTVPLHRLLRFPVTDKLLHLGVIDRDILMTRHTFLNRRYPREGRYCNRLMTKLAIETHRTHMDPVTERDWLVRRLLATVPVGPEREINEDKETKVSQRSRYAQEPFHCFSPSAFLAEPRSMRLLRSHPTNTPLPTSHLRAAGPEPALAGSRRLLSSGSG